VGLIKCCGAFASQSLWFKKKSKLKKTSYYYMDAVLGKKIDSIILSKYANTTSYSSLSVHTTLGLG
jgi:hypothetical protein